MLRIGLLGGMSWESTAAFYRLLNETVRDRLGGLHCADCLVRSVDFATIEPLQRAGDWDAAARVLAAEAQTLEAAGAQLLLLATNTMHRVAPQLQASIGIPLLHIADATACAVHDHGLARVGLIGTAYTMEQDFYAGRLRDHHGLEVIVPEPEDRAIVHRVIYDELCVGVVRGDSRAAYRAVIARLVEAGAQGIVLGCTEIELLVGPADSAVPLFDTTACHARYAVDVALGEESL